MWSVSSFQLHMMVVHTELSQFVLVSVIWTVSRSQQHQTVQTESHITWHVLIWSSLIFICLIQSTRVTVIQSVKFCRMLNTKTGLGISCLALLVTRGVWLNKGCVFFKKPCPFPLNLACLLHSNNIWCDFAACWGSWHVFGCSRNFNAGSFSETI